MDNQHPLVSVVLPVYQSEQVIEKTLKSVASQNYSNLEIIVVNDGSTDKTVEKVEEFRGLHKNINIVLEENKTNCGITKSLNIGIELAKGQYIARLDAGDLMKPNRILSQAQILDEKPDIDVVWSFVDFVNDEDDIICKQQVKNPDKMFKKFKALDGYNPTGINKIVHASVMFRRETIIDIGKYDENFKWGQDGNLWVRLVKKGKLFFLMDDTYTAYHISHTGITANRTKREEKKMNAVYASICISNMQYSRFFHYFFQERGFKSRIYLLLKFSYFFFYKNRF